MKTLAESANRVHRIGVVLRDSHGVAQVRVVTGKQRSTDIHRVTHTYNLHRQQDSAYP
jgi:hypothetical protein